MSSEASTEAVRLRPDSTTPGRSQTTPERLQPWQLFTLAGLIGATIVVLVSDGHTPSGIIVLSLTIIAAAVVGLAAWRALAPLTGLDEPLGPQMLGGRTRAAIEREKTLVLRSIKDLEFDRAMGKVSEKDFAEMSNRLRVRAAGLIRQLDAGGYRQEIEREIARRVGAEPKAQSPEPRAESPAPRSQTCAACGTVNDPDARFCKNCGQAVGGAA